MIRLIFKAVGVVLVVVSIAYVIEQRSNLNHSHPVLSRAPSNILTDDVAVDAATACPEISSFDRKKLTRESGLDLADFVEKSIGEMHAAKDTENRLRVVAERFDSERWSHAFLDTRATDKSTSLSFGALFLQRYHRVIENGLRQEESALRAFHWDENVRQEIRAKPLRAQVQSYLPQVCIADDEARYGCERGETMYRVKTVLSPRIACRFPEKRAQYSAVFWVRVAGPQARILEVEVNGDRLVKATYDDFAHRKLLSALPPTVQEVLVSVGLDPNRTPPLWRQWLQNNASK